MSLHFGDGAVGMDELEPVQQVVHIEDLILLSRYDEAAGASSTLVPRFLEGGNSTEALLQRALVASLQAHFFSGRQQEVEDLVDKLGLQRLAAQTFMAWVLLLLESGQVSAARERIERYMAAVISLLRDRHLQAPRADALGPSGLEVGEDTPPQEGQQHLYPPEQQPHPAAIAAAAEGGRKDHASPSPTIAVQSPAAAVPAWPELDLGPGPGCGCGVGAAAATLQDRAALARLYSQDVLGLGLQLPLEALRWLQPQSPLQPQPQQQQQQPHGGAGGGNALPAGTVAVAVDARELLGCEETVRLLREELKQLLAAARMLPAGLPDVCVSSSDAASISGGAPAGGEGLAAVTATAASTNGQLGAPNAHAHSAAESISFSRGGGAAAAAPAAPRHAPLPADTGSTTTRRQVSLLLPSSPLPALRSLLRTWLAAAHTVVMRLASGGAVQLTRAQTWLVSKAVVAAARLRALARRSPGLGSPYTRVAAALALGAMVMVAMQAEAPHLRTAFEDQWAGLAGLVREALRMGLALHPSPVATVVQPVP